MVSYYGVEKKDVIRSIKEAEDFLRSLGLGPATNQMISEHLTPAVYAELEAAQDDRALAEAVYKLQTKDSLFVQNMLVFYYHALLDTHGVGKEIYDGINAWGAFQATVQGTYPQSARERKEHVTALHFNQCAALNKAPKIPHPCTDMRDFSNPRRDSSKPPRI